MKTATITAFLRSDIEQVWHVVTDNVHTTWRSDLARVEVLDAQHFREISKQGYVIDFTITQKQPYERYAFAMDSHNMQGTWTGFFLKEETGTKVVFTERVHVKRWWMKWLIGSYLQRQQARYVADLRRALGE